MKHKRTQIKHSRMVYACTIMLSVLFLFWGNQLYAGDFRFFDNRDDAQTVTAKVLRIVAESQGQEEQIDVGSVESLQVEFEAEIIKGVRKGERVRAIEQNGGYSPNYMKKVSAKDKVLLQLSNEGQQGLWVMIDYVRTDALLVMGAVFFLLLLLFGRKKGLNTIISLALTFLAIFVVFIPAILTGHNIYTATVVVSAFVIFMSLMVVIGPNKTSLSAGIGCLCGLTVSGLLMPLMDMLFRLTGIVNEESIYLLSINPGNPINLKAVVFASVLIGSLGAALDISVSISSSLYEIYGKMQSPSFRSVVRSGMNVGRDIMGAMTNTLILAYVGSSLSLVLLLISYSGSLTELLSKEMVVIEVLHALVGSIGILIAIPATSVISAMLYDSPGKNPLKLLRK